MMVSLPVSLPERTCSISLQAPPIRRGRHPMTYDRSQRFETRAIHAGQDPDPTTGAVITPIYQTSTFAQEEVGKHSGYDYSRSDNPTRTALQTALAALEDANWALCYASGLAGTQNVWYLLAPGDHMIL